MPFDFDGRHTSIPENSRKPTDRKVSNCLVFSRCLVQVFPERFSHYLFPFFYLVNRLISPALGFEQPEPTQRLPKQPLPVKLVKLPEEVDASAISVHFFASFFQI
jgi:hypothetical protein